MTHSWTELGSSRRPFRDGPSLRQGDPKPAIRQLHQSPSLWGRPFIDVPQQMRL